MSRTVTVLAAACATLLLTLRAGAIPLPALNLSELTRSSDLIAVGVVTSIVEGGPSTFDFRGGTVAARRMTATLRLRRVLKGHLNVSQIAFTFYVPQEFLAFRDISTGQFGMFFLREKPHEQLTVADPYYPFLAAARKAPTFQGNALDRVISEIVQILASTGATEAEQTEAVGALDTIRNRASTAGLRLAASSSYITVRLLAISRLLLRNDVSELQTAENILVSPPPNVEPYLLKELSYGLQGLKDPAAVPVLLRLLTKGVPLSRAQAALSLGEIGDSVAVGPLLKALDDDDRMVRYHAVLALGKITQQWEWAPSISLFESAEDRFVTHWKEWGRTR